MKWLAPAALLLAASTIVATLGACEGDTTPACATASCAEAQTSSSSTGAGQGGQDPGPCFASADSIDACDVDSMPTTGDIPCDVWAVMHKDPLESGGCHACHQNPPPMDPGAPFPLLSYEDLLKKSYYGFLGPNPDERVFQTMLKALQDTPPKGIVPMPYGDAPQLSCDDRRTLTRWLAGDGTPGGCAKPVPAGTGDGTCCAQATPPLPVAVDAGCPAAAP